MNVWCTTVAVVLYAISLQCCSTTYLFFTINRTKLSTSTSTISKFRLVLLMHICMCVSLCIYAVPVIRCPFSSLIALLASFHLCWPIWTLRHMPCKSQIPNSYQEFPSLLSGTNKSRFRPSSPQSCHLSWKVIIHATATMKEITNPTKERVTPRRNVWKERHVM